jgi:hypothetical protein
MNYKKYIELGFKRIDFDDKVEIDRTGYGGYSLTKKINKKMHVSVDSSALDKPKLYIKKNLSDTYHIIPLTPDMILDYFGNDLTYSTYFTTAS